MDLSPSSRSCSFLGQKNPKNIMTCCVIFHNLIVKDERDLDLDLVYDNVGEHVKPARNPDSIKAFLQTLTGRLRIRKLTASFKKISLRTTGTGMGSNLPFLFILLNYSCVL